MNIRLLSLWDRFNGSFWFPPTVFVLLAALLGSLLPVIEKFWFDDLDRLAFLRASPESARTVLSVIAGAMITVTGVIFSVTMATLSIASSQFGSRVMRQNMRNRPTQLALGTFLGTSVFCFLVLRSVGEKGDGSYVPHISIAMAIVAAVVSVFVLIYFIHDVSESVQAPHVVARIAADLNNSIERLFPEQLGEEDDAPDSDDLAVDLSRLDTEPQQIIESTCEGYLQAIDGEALMRVTSLHNVLLELRVRPGEFLSLGDPIARLWTLTGGQAPISQEVNDALIVGNIRTPRQDVNCGIHELAQLTVRALSPGINDPFTALNGIDRLSAALARLVQRRIPSRFRFDSAHHLRVIVGRVTFPEALAAAFNHIRQNISSSPPVGVRMLEGLQDIAREARRVEDLEAIRLQARLIVEAYQNSTQLPADLQGLHAHFAEVESLIEQRLKGESKRDIEASEQTPPEPSDSADSSDNQPPDTHSDGEING